MEPTHQIAIATLIGFVCIAIVLFQFRMGWRQTTGLPLGFLFVIGIAHIGAAVYLLPEYDPALEPYLKQGGVTAEATGLGMIATAVAMASFTIGTLLMPQKPRDLPSHPLSEKPFKTPNKLLLFGLFFLLSSKVVSLIPSAGPVVSSAMFFLISGFCLAFYVANRMGDNKKIWLYGLLLMAFPLLTVGAFGFAAAGVNMLSLGLAFFLYRRKKGDGLFLLKLVPFVLLVFYIGSSAYITYMQNRSMLRNTIWRGVGISARLEAMAKAASNFEPFDWTDPRHLYLIDARLNQSSLTGRAILTHRHSSIKFENGKTLVYAVFAWVPRILWPGKPTAGGSDFVTRHTGRKFSRGTSVSAGQVFELYVNFGYAGVAIGFAILGALVRWFDLRACEHLSCNDLAKFIRYHVIGMVLIQPSSFVFFMVTSVAGAFVVTIWLCRWLVRSELKPA